MRVSAPCAGYASAKSLSNSSIATAGEVVNPIPVSFVRAIDACMASAAPGKLATAARVGQPRERVWRSGFDLALKLLHHRQGLLMVRAALAPLSESGEYLPNIRNVAMT